MLVLTFVIVLSAAITQAACPRRHAQVLEQPNELIHGAMAPGRVLHSILGVGHRSD